MAQSLEKGLCSRGAFRLVLLLVGVVLVGYTAGPPLRGSLKKTPSDVHASCSCFCECSSEFGIALPLALGLSFKEKNQLLKRSSGASFEAFHVIGPINDSFTDCGKHNPELSKEMEKDVVALLSEELTLQKSVADDTFQHSKELIIDARKASFHYQREAEKCTAGTETCEEARERAEKELREESRLSALWEKRAREHGFRDER